MHHHEVKKNVYLAYLYGEFWFEERGKTVFSFSAAAIKPFRVELWAETRFCFFFLFRGDLLVSQLLKKARKKNKVLHGTPDLCIIMQLTQEANWKLVIKL